MKKNCASSWLFTKKMWGFQYKKMLPAEALHWPRLARCYKHFRCLLIWIPLLFAILLYKIQYVDTLHVVFKERQGTLYAACSEVFDLQSYNCTSNN